MVLSSLLILSLEYLVDRIWEDLGMVKIYTKKRGAHPDLDDPICLRKGATIEVRQLLVVSICALRLNYLSCLLVLCRSLECLQWCPQITSFELPICTRLVSCPTRCYQGLYSFFNSSAFSRVSSSSPCVLVCCRVMLTPTLRENQANSLRMPRKSAFLIPCRTKMLFPVRSRSSISIIVDPHPIHSCIQYLPNNSGTSPEVST